MPKRRIVLANASRLLREMLKRIIDKSENLELVSEITDPQDLLSGSDHADPEWVMVSLSFENCIPDWVDGYMANHASVRFLAFAADGSKIKMKWFQVHEQELYGLSLNDLIHILENKPSAS
jgi:hypothetical protein